MKTHPVAALFPLLEGAELQALADDMKVNGQLVPAWVTKGGEILDGRNRAIACDLLGLALKTKVYEGTEERIPAFIASLNLRRRHLTPNQCALIAAEMANLGRGNPTGNNQHIRGNPPGGGIPPAPTPISTTEAAKVMGVSPRAVERAKRITKAAPDLAVKVKAGEVTLGAAEKEVAAVRASLRKHGAQKRRNERNKRIDDGLKALRKWLDLYGGVPEFGEVREAIRRAIAIIV